MLPQRVGWVTDPKRVRRLYNELGPQLRNNAPKCRFKAKLRSDRQEPTQSHQIWAMDFFHAQLATGWKVRILAIVVTYAWYAPATDLKFSYNGGDVVITLAKVCQQIDYPRVIRCDYDSECVSRDLVSKANPKGVVVECF
ncbi:hypothetical protein PsAD2_01649 [Pseudovibrio axinellae]|uniref:Integrase core domain protein n=1 Tax=Pseudovibrio axinellae TaxID=989403 RepID=A0A165ZF73_9HYPH|nr:hypothetical protein PsAD2_01649 [Pseudovibrio axinellae]SER39863.1 putative transposase [Pseudovibrio axinellae]